MTVFSQPSISLVAAVARNGVIGRGNTLPWHLPEDLKRFKALTMGHPVIMGRKTFDSIVAMLKKPLPGRTSIVISRSPGALRLSPDWTTVRPVATLDEAIRQAQADAPIHVIGGAQIYELALPHATRLYMTEVLSDVAGDAHFPQWDRSQWQEVSREHGPAAPEGLQYDFVEYRRR